MPISLNALTRTANRHTANSRLGRRLLRTLPVPADLAGITEIDSRREVDPPCVGLRKDDVSAIWHAVEDLYCTGYYPAIMLCLRRRGEIVLNRAIGHSRGFGELGGPDSPQPISINTPACIYSASKSITAMLIHKLADQGQINLLDPVAHYIPEFGKHGKDRLNILQILSHRGGVPGIKTDLKISELIKHQTLFDLICESEPIDSHGRTQAYHAITGGTILQAVLERVSGQPIEVYWRKNFKGPMKLRHFDYGAAGQAFEGMARDQVTGATVPGFARPYFRQYRGLDIEKDRDFLNDPVWFTEPVPAGNMIATAEEASRFFQMLLDEGRYGNQQLLSPLAVHRATWEASPHQLDNVLKVPLRYSAGMMLGGAPFGLFGGHCPNAFGHNGLINILVWADPDRDIAVALLNTGKPLIAHNLLFLVNVLTQISRRIPRDSQRAYPH